MFDEQFLTELSERNPIEDVVGSYVNLSKRSGQNLFGLCPFHNERTPSFSVSPSKGIYHCFGCGKGGSVINFIMEIENCTFPEAVEKLANRAGMSVPEYDTSELSKKRKRIYELNKDAARFFYSQLSTPDGKLATDYLSARKLKGATVKDFGLGFAPDTWDSLRNAMAAKGYSDMEMYDAGLVKKGRNGGFYDAFRKRLMFPVIDVRGNVLGFSGRILGEGEPKYYNSPDTAVFTKGKNLFGLNLAKKSRAGYILLVEGNVDVCMLHQNGFDSAVASLGTALTNEQANLISRFTDEVVLAYDSDTAGQKATRRAIEIFEKLSVKTRVLVMSGAKDPDEYIKSKGAAAFGNLIEGSKDQMDYRLQTILSKYDLDNSEQKVSYLREASSVVATFPDQIKREVYARQLASVSGVNPEAVSKEIEAQRSKLVKSASRRDMRETMRVAQSAQPKDKEQRYENLTSAMAEEGVIRLIANVPSVSCDLKKEEFSSERLGSIYELIRQSDTCDFALFSQILSQEDMNLLTRISEAEPIDKSKLDIIMNDYIKRIRAENAKSGTTDLRVLAEQLKNEGKGYKP